MKTDIWMPIFINTYLQDTAHLEYEDHGFYMIALMRLWQNGGELTKLKFRKIEKISPKKFEKKFKKISEFFQFNGEIFSQKRLKRELDKSTKNVESKRKAANTRWELERQSGAGASIVHDAESQLRISSTPTPTPIDKSIYSDQSVPMRAAKFLYQKILDRNPNHKKPDFQKWAGVVDKMIRIDKRAPSQIAKVIEWCQADDFWQNNILSTEKLRKKYDQLALKSELSKPVKKQKAGKFDEMHKSYTPKVKKPANQKRKGK